MKRLLDHLAGCARFGMRPGLEAIDAVAAALGRPERSFPSIHIAGTNGKGAVAAILDAALRARSLAPVTRYTSPHLVRINERFFVDGTAVGDDALAAAADDVLAALGADRLTYFETLTAVAFVLFARFRPAFAVIECGLGGRLDATNLVVPAVSVITRLGLDHCDWLGDTIEKIAAEKAGIVQPGVPVVLGANEPVVREVVSLRAAELGAPFVYAPDLADESEIPGGFSLGGAFNRENAVTALAVLRTLEGLGTVPAAPDPCAGFNAVCWPGRYQRLGATLVDGAHNPPAAAALAAALRADGVQARSLALVSGFCGDKDVAAVLRTLSPLVARGYAVKTSNPRSLSAAETAARMRAAGIDAMACASLDEALAHSGAASAAKEQVAAAPSALVAGSLFLAGEALAALGAVPAPSDRRPDPFETLVTNYEPRNML